MQSVRHPVRHRLATAVVMVPLALTAACSDPVATTSANGAPVRSVAGPLGAIDLPGRRSGVDTSRFVTRFRDRGEGGVFIRLTGEPTANAVEALMRSGLRAPAGRSRPVTFDSLKIRTVWGHLTRGQVRALAQLPWVERIESSEDEDAIASQNIDYGGIWFDVYAPETSAWNLQRVRAPQIWRDFGMTGAVTNSRGGADLANVAVLDDGADDGLGYANPGWDVFALVARASWNFSHDQSTYVGQHGTWVSSFIGGEPNGMYTAGVAPRSGKLSYKVLPAGSDWGPIVNGMNQTYAQGDVVVNMSFGNCGSLPPSTVHTAIQRMANREFYDVNGNPGAWGKGQLLVAAAGNGLKSVQGCTTRAIQYPAAYNEVIAVGAIDINNAADPGLSTGPTMELVAPGLCVNGLRVGGGVDSCISGTSFAAPHVAGLAGLIRVKYRSLTAADLRQRLRSTATNLGPSGKDDVFGYGLVNAYAVISALQPPPDPEPCEPVPPQLVCEG